MEDEHRSEHPPAPPGLAPGSPTKDAPTLYPMEASRGEHVANGIKFPCTEQCTPQLESRGEGLAVPPLPGGDGMEVDGGKGNPSSSFSSSSSSTPANGPCPGFDRQVHGVFHGILAGIVGAQSLVFGKASAEIITGSFRSDMPGVNVPVLLFCLMMMILTVVIQLVSLNRGLRYHPSLLIVPVYQTFWTLTGILGGAVCFNEFENHETYETLLFVAGGLSMLGGLYCLVRANPDHQQLDGGGEESTGRSSSSSSGRNASGTEQGQADSRSSPIINAVVAMGEQIMSDLDLDLELTNKAGFEVQLDVSSPGVHVNGGGDRV